MFSSLFIYHVEIGGTFTHKLQYNTCRCPDSMHHQVITIRNAPPYMPNFIDTLKIVNAHQNSKL